MGSQPSSHAVAHDYPAQLPVLTEFYNPTDAGYVLYWITFGIMMAAAICFAIITWFQPMHRRKHGYITTIIPLIAAVAYYSMAAHGGDVLIRQYWYLPGARDVFYARYIDWFLTTPLLLLDLLMIANVPVGTALWIVACDMFMILLGLFGAISSEKFRFGWYGIGVGFQFLITWGMLVVGTRHALLRSKRLGSAYISLAVYLVCLWFGYPVVWGLCEGSNTITVDAEIACYMGLDIAAKVVFGALVFMTYPLINKIEEEESEKYQALPSLLEAPVSHPLLPAYMDAKGHVPKREVVVPQEPQPLPQQTVQPEPQGRMEGPGVVIPGRADGPHSIRPNEQV